MYTVTTQYGYAHYLRLTPDAELRYVCRPAPPDKKRGGSSALSLHSRSTTEGGASASPLSVDTNFTAPKKGKGGRNGYGVLAPKPTRFTSRAKNSVRWAAAAIEREFGKENCYFVTLTLPGSSLAAMQVFASWSSWVLDCLNKWLLRHCQWTDGNCYRVSVWELQDRGALHLHLLVAAPSADFSEPLKEYWRCLLEGLSAESKIDVFERKNGKSWSGRCDKKIRDGRRVRDLMCDVQQVKKSVTSYLSKYLGKGSKFKQFYPARWWSLSNCSRSLVAKYTIQIPLPRTNAEGATAIDEFVKEALGCSRLCAESIRNFGHESAFHVGWIAWDEYEVLHGLIGAIGETIEGHLDSIGHISGVQQLRRECAYQPLQQMKERNESENEYEIELALQYALSSKLSLQMERAKLGIHIDYMMRQKLKEMRMQLDIQRR